jgi:hypothetical protein
VLLVELSRQPLRQPPRVGEHDRRTVPTDQLTDPLLDRRPDRAALLGSRRRPLHLTRWLAERGHVGDRHLHPNVNDLVGRRLDDLNRPPAGQEGRHLVHRAHRRRQPDPLRRSFQQRIQPLQ